MISACGWKYKLSIGSKLPVKKENNVTYWPKLAVRLAREVTLVPCISSLNTAYSINSD
jgi:hypothetical protein